MISVLITIGAFLAIVTTFILKSINNDSKSKNIKRAIIIVVSLAIYVICCLLLLQYKVFS